MPPEDFVEGLDSNRSVSGQGLFKTAYNNFKNASVGQMNKMGGLHSNEAINSFTGIPELGARIFRGNQGLEEAWKDTFTEIMKDEHGKVMMDKEGKNVLRKTRWGKLAGSVWAAGTALSAVGGAARGALTDKNSTFDIPGIPFI